MQRAYRPHADCAHQRIGVTSELISLSSTRDERGFVRLSLEGTWPTIDELITWYKSLGDIRVLRLFLIDMRNASGPLPKFPDIRDTVGAFEADVSHARERKRAVIVASDVQFGIARSFQALVGGQMEVFRDEATAIEWLLARA
jgi:hypothetical protein